MSSISIEDSGEIPVEIRSKIFLHHPLLTSSEVLMTPPIEELFQVIKRTVTLRETGCCFTARSGVGKTYAVSMIAKMLKIQMPQLSIFEHDAQNQQIPSIRAFFKHFLNTVKHGDTKGETYDLRLRLTNFLIDDARQSGLNTVVLFIDEAQAMAMQDFFFLKDVYNDLNRAGVKLITVMMGQDPDFGLVLNKLKNNVRLDLVSRFTIRRLPFRAYSNLHDLAQIFKGIDSAVYPEDSGYTWTFFFFPKAYRAGFRMVNEASNFYAALSDIGSSIAAAPMFPARQLFLAIRAFMVDNAALDGAELKLPGDAWKKAIRYAQVGEAMLLMQAYSFTEKIRIKK